MTDERKSENLDAEERALEQALNQALATGQEPRLLSGGGDLDANLVREYTELIGLLPYELAPERPAADLKDRIMAKISHGVGVAVPVDSPAATLSQHPAASGADTERFAASSSASSKTTRRSWNQYAMAAAFVTCLLGLGFMAGLSWIQRQEIDRLQGQLVATVDPASQDEVLQVRHELQTMKSRLNMITNVARQAYPMRRVNHSPSQKSPEGIVYVCGQHQRWYVSLRGLETPAEGEEYHIRFITDQGHVDGGVLDVRDDASSEMESMSMPPETHGFVVTLEKVGALDTPESLTVLLGENPINL